MKRKTKNLSYKLQIILSSILCLVVPIYSENPTFYRQKPRGERCEKIGGANAPPNSLTKPRECGFGRVSVARVWPGGHTLLGCSPASRFVFIFSWICSLSLGFWRNGLWSLASTDRFVGICSNWFSTDLNKPDLPWFTEFELILI